MDCWCSTELLDYSNHPAFTSGKKCFNFEMREWENENEKWENERMRICILKYSDWEWKNKKKKTWMELNNICAIFTEHQITNDKKKGVLDLFCFTQSNVLSVSCVETKIPSCWLPLLTLLVSWNCKWRRGIKSNWFVFVILVLCVCYLCLISFLFYFSISTFNYKSGQYLFLNCPYIARQEWHPFTITSAPQEDFVSVHIRVSLFWHVLFCLFILLLLLFSESIDRRRLDRRIMEISQPKQLPRNCARKLVNFSRW